MKWIVYYDNGSSFTDEDGPPETAPRDGVQAVGIADIGVGKLLWHSFDFYCWLDGEWVPRSERGIFDYLRQPGKEKIVLQARATSVRNFLSVYDQAVADPRLPFKTGLDPKEPVPPR